MIRNPSQTIDYRTVFVEQNEFVTLKASYHKGSALPTWKLLFTTKSSRHQPKVSTDLGKVDNRFCIVRTKNLQYFVWSPFFIELCHILEEFEDHGLQYELNKMFLKSVLDNNFISTGTDTSNFLPFIPCSYIRFSYLGIY